MSVELWLLVDDERTRQKIIKCLRKHSKAFFDIHAMVSNPEKWVDEFAAAGSNSMTFHIEVCIRSTGQSMRSTNAVPVVDRRQKIPKRSANAFAPLA